MSETCTFSTYGYACGKHVEHGRYLCEEHAAAKCSSCGKPATHGCDFCGQFVCGAPLCDECTFGTDESKSAGAWGFMNHLHISKPEFADKHKVAKLEAALAAKDAEIAALQLRLKAVEHSVRVGADVDHERDFLAMEARRYASHYPEASDGRNTFVMFAEMIEARSALKEQADA